MEMAAINPLAVELASAGTNENNENHEDGGGNDGEDSTTTIIKSAARVGEKAKVADELTANISVEVIQRRRSEVFHIGDRNMWRFNKTQFRWNLAVTGTFAVIFGQVSIVLDTSSYHD